MCPLDPLCPNFWLYILAGLASVFNFITSGSPIHESFIFRQTIIDFITLITSYIISFGPLLNDMLLEFTLLSIVLVLEGIHLIYAGWRWLKRIIEG